MTSASKNNLLYTARELEFDTGLQFNRMRYYCSDLGRFIYKDFIKNKFLFSYAKNNPLKFRDMFGLLPEWFQRFFWVPLIFADEPTEYYDRCVSPRSDSDCTIYCSNKESCENCCMILYPYSSQASQLARCLSLCH